MTTGMPIQEAVRTQSDRDHAAEQAIASAPLTLVLRLTNVVMALAALATIAMAYGAQEYALAFLVTGASFAVLGVLGLVLQTEKDVKEDRAHASHYFSQ